VRTISSRQNAIVREFRALAATPDPAGARVLLDGVHLVRDAQHAGVAFEIVAIATSRLQHPTEEAAVARELAAGGAELVSADGRVFDAMSPVRTPSGLLAIARRTPMTAADICRHAGFIVAAIDVQDPGNLGSLVRAAEAGGATGVLVCGASANPFSWKAVRGSMGSALRLPIANAPSADAALACMKKFGLRTIAAVPRSGADPDDLDWQGKVGLLLGSEGPGLEPAVVAACDAQVTIPMSAPVESLNVAAAGAILVYAARRQRQ
jgi:TrmH family RNA methyltransferase